MKSCEYLTAHQRMYISLYIPFLRDTGLYPYPTKHPDSKLAFTMVQKKNRSAVIFWRAGI